MSPVAPGTRLGSFEITSKLGEGGMGEVWRATDSKLRRDVAIKVLPAAFVADTERLARFEREAQLLAQLQHPGIASIYGLEESDGTLALVMELVPGPTLAERLESGPLALEECLAFALQIAQALEAAHDKGIVHRDLKPQNIKLTAEGKVKVLDFGLAKAMEADASGSGAGGSVAQIAASPTLTLGATQLGMILGTAAYMSPEQAKGAAVDRRADIWAFGVVLHEMLTGARLFEAPTVPETLAQVLTRTPDLATLPASTPAAIRALLRRCLERQPANRLRDIGDARLVLEDALAGRGDEPGAPTVTPPARESVLPRIALAAAGALAVGVAIGYFTLRGSAGGVAAEPLGFERLTFRPGHFVNARFAPDGQTVFLAADWDRNEREIFQVRPNAGELALGVRGVELLAVSRTGELAVLLPRVETGNPYSVSGTLAVVSASGGTPRELADDVTGADWLPDGKSLAAIRVIAGRQRLEFPLGNPVYDVPERIQWLRVSPAGDAAAFFELSADDWSVVLVDRSGARRVLSGGWADWWNLAWSPDGQEVWFGAARAGAAATLYAVDRGGTVRPLLTAPGTLEVHDVAPDGGVLVALVSQRTYALGGRPEALPERDLSWLEDSVAVDISGDGKRTLLDVNSEREGGVRATYLRTADDPNPVRLGSGRAQELSRDGRWALVVRGGEIAAMPTAAGGERVIDSGFPLVEEARFLPDGIHVIAVANEAGGRSVATILSLAGEAAKVIAAPFELRPGSGNNRSLSPVSPDGTLVAAAMASGQILIVPLDGGEPRPLPGSGVDDIPTQWSADGSRLFVFDPSRLPARIHAIDVTSGRRELWREIAPNDRAGVAGVYRVLVTPDRAAYAYSYQQFRSSLYLVKGLR